MVKGIQSFGRYWQRFALLYFARASWARDQMFGYLVAVAILVYQVYSGQLQAAVQALDDVESLFWPYAIVFAIYALYQFAVTAWRMDNNLRAQGFGIQVHLSPRFREERLFVDVANYGPKATFWATMSSIVGVDGVEELPRKYLIPWNAVDRERVQLTTGQHGEFEIGRFAVRTGEKASKELPGEITFLTTTELATAMPSPLHPGHVYDPVVLHVTIENDDDGHKTFPIWVQLIVGPKTVTRIVCGGNA